MSECMPIPDNWKDFVKEYSFKDIREIYTNGSWLIPTFRVEQMMEHYLVEKQVAEYWYQGYYKLLGELANYKWVSIKDRMPEEGENVLTYGARPFYDVFYVNRLIDKKNGEWLYDGVTHWMPLPQKPESEGDAEC